MANHEHGHEHGGGDGDGGPETLVTALLITRTVDGDITTVFDIRTAAAAGAACGATYFLLRRLFGR